MPKPHLSRKVVLIVGAALVMCGGTGAAAVFIGADTLLGPSYAELNGFACTELQAVEIQKKDRFWIRKYVTIEEPSDGLGRVKTALRVAKAVQAAKKADLVQVVVLDLKGPTSRAQMRGRSVGADVIYVPDPKRVPEEASARVLTARYIDGTAAANGQFFGDRFDMPEEDINALVAKLNDATDCLKPEVETPAADGHGEPAAGGHGEKASGHEAPAEGHGETSGGHGEAPADAHGEAPAEGHGDAPTAGHGEETPVAEHGGGEAKGWMASVMGMVGLGGEEAPADGHAAPAEDHATAPAEGHDAAPAEDHAAAPTDGHDAAPAEDHAAAPAEGHDAVPAEDHAAAPTEGHDAAPAEDHVAAPAEGHDAAPAEDHAAAPAEGHDAAPVEDHAAAPADAAAAPAEEGGWFDGLKSMVGLGGEDAAKPGQDQAAAPDSADGPAAEPIQGDDWLAKMRAAPIKSDAGASAAPAGAGHSETPAATDAEAKAGGQHKAEAGAAGHDAGGHGAAGAAAEVPAEDEAILPPKVAPKTDEHAKADH